MRDAHSGFLLTGTLGDPTWAIESVLDELGPDTVAYLKHYGHLWRYVGYAAEARLGGFDVSPVAIQTFAGLTPNVLNLRDPLCLAIGEAEALERLVRSYGTASQAI